MAITLPALKLPNPFRKQGPDRIHDVRESINQPKYHAGRYFVSNLDTPGLHRVDAQIIGESLTIMCKQCPYRWAGVWKK